jgi:hypothetical protein
MSTESIDWSITTLNPKLSEQLGRIDGKLTTLHRFFYVNVVIGNDTTTTRTAPVSSIQPQDPAVIVGDVVVGNDGYLASVTAISTTTLTLTPLNLSIGGSNHALCYYNGNVTQNSGGASRGVIPLPDVLPTPRVGDYIIGKNGYIVEVRSVVLGNNTVEYIGTAKNLTGYTNVTTAADTAISGGTATDVLDYLRQITTNGNYIYDNTANIYYCRVTVQGDNSQIIWVEVVHCSSDLQLHRYTYRNGVICKKTDEGPSLTRMSYLADPIGGNDAVNLGYLENNYLPINNPAAVDTLTLQQGSGTSVTASVSASAGVDIIQLTGDNQYRVLRGLSDPLDNTDAVPKSYADIAMPFVITLDYDTVNYSTDVTRDEILAALNSHRRIVGYFSDQNNVPQQLVGGSVDLTCHDPAGAQAGQRLVGLFVGDWGLSSIEVDFANAGYATWREAMPDVGLPMHVTFTGTTVAGSAHSSVDFGTLINAVRTKRVIAPRYLDDINNVYYNLVTARYVTEGAGQVYVAQGVFYNESGTGALEKVITCKQDSSGCYIYIH